MKYLFFVQSEGRGHMSQALALKEKLEQRGHKVVGTIIGLNPSKKIPPFFSEEINCPLITIASPTFATDKKDKGVKVFLSTIITLWRLPRYWRSIKIIKQTIKKLQPDILVNFYEPLAGNYYRLSRDKRPMFCISHQHFIEHPQFQFPKITWLARFSFRFYNRLTASSHATRIALSFTQEIDLPNKKLFVCPPLIRKKILQQTAANKHFILVYLVNSGYYEEVLTWCQKNPQQRVVGFWDKLGEIETHFGNNLTFHYIDGQKFINYLANCSNYVCTAGFDSVAEAAYLQKNILVIPTKNHFEQKCNAIDARRAGLAISASTFDLSLLIAQPKTHSLEIFKEWVNKYDHKIVDLLEK